MNSEDYVVYESVGGLMCYAYRPTGEVLLRTMQVSLDTLMRLAIVDHAKRKNIGIQS